MLYFGRARNGLQTCFGIFARVSSRPNSRTCRRCCTCRVSVLLPSERSLQAIGRLCRRDDLHAHRPSLPPHLFLADKRFLAADRQCATSCVDMAAGLLLDSFSVFFAIWIADMLSWRNSPFH
eukprot:6208770-Pleurochrysis_carterae.AAC.1